MQQAKVLIVDDNRDLAEGLASFVRMIGHDAVIANNGQEALEHHKRSDFDVTLMDVRMPVMNGVDSFFEIRRLRPDAKVILMTGMRERIVERALSSGAVCLKPFPLSELLAHLVGAISAPDMSPAPSGPRGMMARGR